MLPTLYLFILDVSSNAIQSGYLDIFADELLNEYKSLPGILLQENLFIDFEFST